MVQKLDIIVLGATGFTGKYVVRYLHELTRAKGRHLTWGIAGRDTKKLKTILDNLTTRTGDMSILDVPITIADLSDDQSIRAMASKARIVINCCGPYRFMGETVVRACVEAGTHHVDVSGEPHYMEKIQLNYNEKAKEKGIYIVSACGLDSIPSDLGVIFLQQQFEGTLNSVETFVKFDLNDSLSSGSIMNYATWESAVHEVGYVKKLKYLRTKLFAEKLPKMEPKLKRKLLPFRFPLSKEWAVFFPGPDRSVIYRTQRYFHEVNRKRPVQIQTYLVVPNWANITLLALLGLIFTIMVRFEFGRKLVLRYPSLFSFGLCSTETPSEKNVEKSTFCVTLVGKGWKGKLHGITDEYKQTTNKQIIGQVTGHNPGYGTTSICLVLAAIVILTEPSRIPPGGGVFSPGAIFAETSLIEQLNENGVKFMIIKN